MSLKHDPLVNWPNARLHYLHKKNNIGINTCRGMSSSGFVFLLRWRWHDQSQLKCQNKIKKQPSCLEKTIFSQRQKPLDFSLARQRGFFLPIVWQRYVVTLKLAPANQSGFLRYVDTFVRDYACKQKSEQHIRVLWFASKLTAEGLPGPHF